MQMAFIFYNYLRIITTICLIITRMEEAPFAGYQTSSSKFAIAGKC